MASGGNQDSVVRAWVDELEGDLGQIRLLPIRRPVRRVVLAVMQESQRLNIKLLKLVRLRHERLLLPVRVAYSYQC
jgi:hypothetical protein